ncbi:MAG TPA: V-type ATP synthase subunit A, partial [Flexistipes sinusarabici]|nr:V-type ATP synthase subunit A [Flexistipes sinusarabici]
MKGKLIGISGYIVKARLPEAGIYDRVLVGERELTGEIIKISGEDVIIQVYEDTRGLG